MDSLSRYLVVAVLGSFLVITGFLWLGNSQLGGDTAQNALLAGFLFIAVALGNLLVGVTYLEALQYTASVLENDEGLE